MRCKKVNVVEITKASSGVWKFCKAALAVVIVAGLAAEAPAAPILVHVTPEGDGNTLRARYGTFDTWNDYAFQTTANPVQALHTFASGWGEIKNAYVQISLATVPNNIDVELATLNLYITNASGSGSRLMHLADSSNATGHANQTLNGDTEVMALSGNTSKGWVSIDVTEFIQSDLDKGHDWAVFSLPSLNYSNLSFHGSSDPDYGPYLSVTLIPEPASLGVLSLVGLLLFKRRRR